MFTKLLLLLSSLLLFACGSKQVSQVNLEVRGSLQFGGATLSPISTGGLMLWGQSSTGQAFSQALRNSETLNLTLPNGSWRFFAMAWANATNIELDATTAVRCALTPITTLDGGDNTISLELSQTACAAPIFKGDLANLSQMTTKFHACESVQGFLPNSVCTLDRADPNRLSDKAPIMSVKITLDEYTESLAIPIGPGLSRCLSFGNTPFSEAQTLTAGSLVLPMGGNALNPFRIRLTYDLATADCSGTAIDTFTTVMPRGLQQTFPNQARVITTNEFKFAEAHSDLRLCQGRGTKTPFAGGNGDDHNPYLICSEKQLYEMHASALYLDKSFRLGRSLNLNNFLYTGVPIAGVHPLSADCWEPGQTWQPLGGIDYAPFPTCTPTDTGTAFSGNFDGNNHSIKGLRFRFEDLTNVGFISKWYPTTQAKYIRDIVLIDPEVSGGNQVGSLIGWKQDNVGNPNTISGIKVIGGIVEARIGPTSSLGGAIGKGIDLNLIDITVDRTRIYHEGGYVGGIIGELNNTNIIKELHSYAHILPQYNSEFNGVNVGGVAGYVYSTTFTAPITSITHQGIIVTPTSNVGGLFGFIHSNQPMSSTYATSALTTTNDQTVNNLGGLVGFVDSNLAISNSYFAGHLVDKCTAGAGCFSGRIYANKGAVTVSGTNQFVYQEDNFTIVSGDAGITPIVVNNFVGPGSTLYDTATAPSLSTPDFVRLAGELPRLASEDHICATIADASGFTPRQSLSQQIINGRGTLGSPLIICNKDQFSELATLSGEKHVKIATGIHLSGAFSEPTIQLGTKIDGKRGYLFGYNKQGLIAAADIRSPIHENYGEIKNLMVANINSLATDTSDTAGYNSAFVHTNHNIIDGVNIVSANVTNANGAGQINSGGLAVFNEATGTIRNSRFGGHVSIGSSFGGLVHTNNGIIKSSISDMIFVANAVGSDIAGIAKENGIGSTISSVLVEGYVKPSVNLLNNITFGVVNNQGKIEDVEIGSSARWIAALDVNFAIIALNNNASGIIKRVVSKGQLLNDNNTSDVINNANSGLPTLTNSGTVEGVVTIAPSGRLILSDIIDNHTCVGSTLTVDPTNLITPFNQGGTYFNSTDFNVTKLVWLSIEDNGEINAIPVNAQTAITPITLTLDGTCTDIGYGTVPAGTSLSLIQSYQPDIATGIGNLASPPYNGFSRNNDLNQAKLNTTPWTFDNSIISSMTNPTDFEDLVQYYIAETLGQPLPPIAPWDIEDNLDMSLIKIRD